jgi:hypothetical protein
VDVDEGVGGDMVTHPKEVTDDEVGGRHPANVERDGGGSDDLGVEEEVIARERGDGLVRLDGGRRGGGECRVGYIWHQGRIILGIVDQVGAHEYVKSDGWADESNEVVVWKMNDFVAWGGTWPMTRHPWPLRKFTDLPFEIVRRARRCDWATFQPDDQKQSWSPILVCSDVADVATGVGQNSFLFLCGLSTSGRHADTLGKEGRDESMEGQDIVEAVIRRSWQGWFHG